MNDRGTAVAVNAIVVLGAALMCGVGVWMWGWPESFAAYVHFPVHVHFLHDLGVFHIGLAVALLVALVRRDAIFVVLVGYTVTCVLHAGNHVLDLHLGGHPSQPYLIAVQALIGGLGAWLRTRQLRAVRLARPDERHCVATGGLRACFAARAALRHAWRRYLADERAVRRSAR
jgi:hypothetical protein